MNDILKYMDFFGTTLNFYSDKQKKYYTSLGGAFTLLSIFICFISSILLAKDGFKRNLPANFSYSEIQQKTTKIKLEDEKIWIPWRIVDSNGIFINNNGLIFPIIYYNYYERKSTKEQFKINTKKINFKLCKEILKSGLSNLFSFEIPLNELYCIDSEDIEIGGSWTELFNNYIKFDISLCENNNNSGEEDINCSFNNYDNSLKFELYYPQISIKQNDKNYPFSIIYKQHSFAINKFTQKNEKLFLQKNILLDDKGWFGKSVTKSSFWGINKIDQDYSNNINNKNIIYSFQINLSTNVIEYYRSYKKVNIIISEIFPIIYIIYIILKKIAKIFKVTEQNKMLTELIYENFLVKRSKFKKIIVLHNSVSNGKPKHNSVREQTEILINQVNQKQTPKLKKNTVNNNLHLDYLSNINIHDNISNQMNDESLIDVNNNNNSKSLILNERKNKDNSVDIRQQTKENIKIVNFLENNILRNPQKKSSQSRKDLEFKNHLFPKTEFKKNEISSNASENGKIFILTKLFPYKYYFFLVFCKNLDINKSKFCFDKKFVKANLFLNQLLDISSYLLLQREFQVLKNRILSKEDITFIEKGQKININNRAFLRLVNECLEKNKFYILASNWK